MIVLLSKWLLPLSAVFMMMVSVMIPSNHASIFDSFNNQRKQLLLQRQRQRQPGDCQDPCVAGTEDIMSIKAHGTSQTPVQSPLRWGCDTEVADQICNFNRHYAEYSGYWETTSFLSEIANHNIQAASSTSSSSTPVPAAAKPMSFYDSNTGKLLFTAPKNRSWQDFLDESRNHGWPSFRDDEVNWDTVRVLKNGETVSMDGTHLGHNLPDAAGRRYCINLVSIAGNPVAETTEQENMSRRRAAGQERQRPSDL